MKSIFERVCAYLGSFRSRTSHNAWQPAEPPLLSPEARGIRTAPGDPYGEMRKALAITMLLG